MCDTMPRLLFAAPKSGSGKTLFTCGMIELCKRRKLRTVSFKCGPDYIDPMFHRKVLGIPAGNLDTYFTEEETTRYLLWEKAKDADITILEGVMGYYDGLGGQSERASTYEVARVTKTPVILVVDGKGASVSLAALIQGIMAYREDSGIRGVLLNRVSGGYYERLRQLIERECGVPVFGYVPELTRLQVPSRHLGLFAPEEIPAFEKWIADIADAMEKTVDVDGLLAVAKKADICVGKIPQLPVLPGPVRLAVARDEAFSFYYSQNLELFVKMGAKLVFFSPLHDAALPQDIDGLLLGGGYPEQYGGELEAAAGLRKEIKQACQTGLPCLAECGGFLYLQKELADADGAGKEMVGLLPGKAYGTGKLCRFGYMEAECLSAGVLGEKGQKVRGHEFHYWDCTENGKDILARKPAGKTAYPCMIHTRTLAAGFPHFYYYSNPGMAYQFLLACKSYQAGRLAKAHWDSIAKPIDSLGLLEEQVVKLCRIQGSCKPYELSPKALLILCGDHGVVQEGVTQTGSQVTRIVSENFAKGCSTVNYMARFAGADVYAVDIGMDTTVYPEKRLVQGAVVDRKVAKGSGNIAREAAMTLEQCIKAVETGCSLVGELKEKGYQVIATGEMGIGNTTPTSVLAAAFMKLTPEAVTGKGAGLSAEGLDRKCRVVRQALKRIEEKGLTDPLAILAEAGGYEIAGMAGVFLGAVKYRIPVVIDGAISSVAALAAQRMDPRAVSYMLASHQSEEVTGKLALQELGQKAILHAGMCLGEGTGAVAVFPILDMAMEVYRNMGTFTEYQIEPYTRYDTGKEEK